MMKQYIQRYGYRVLLSLWATVVGQVCAAEAVSMPVQEAVKADVHQAILTASLAVTGGWVRASMPGAGNSVAFLTVNNRSEQEQVIVGVTCTVAQRCELHQHTHSGGKMRMEKVDRLIVPAKASLALSSGGYHIMLLDLQEPLEPGRQVELVLLLEDKTVLPFSLPVKSVHEE